MVRAVTNSQPPYTPSSSGSVFEPSRSSPSQPPSSTSSKRATKGPQLRIACDNCHTSKVRCSGEKTGCSRCSGQNWNCTYSPSLRLGKPKGSKNKHQRIGISKAGKERRSNRSIDEVPGSADIQGSEADLDHGLSSPSLTSPVSQLDLYSDYGEQTLFSPFDNALLLDTSSLGCSAPYLTSPLVASTRPGSFHTSDPFSADFSNFDYVSYTDHQPKYLEECWSFPAETTPTVVNSVPYTFYPNVLPAQLQVSTPPSTSTTRSLSDFPESDPGPVICPSQEKLKACLTHFKAAFVPTQTLNSFLSASDEVISALYQHLSNISQNDLCAFCDQVLHTCYLLLDQLLVGLLDARLPHNTNDTVVSPQRNSTSHLSRQAVGSLANPGPLPVLLGGFNLDPLDPKILGRQRIREKLQSVQQLLILLQRVSHDTCARQNHASCVHYRVQTKLEPRCQAGLAN